MNLKAARTSAFLSVLFLVVYGTCSWLTSLRHDVHSFYFQWERHIPFVPVLILPYMSIDLFFVAAPFLCRTDRERRTLSHRIISAILIAGACFLLMPLRFAFDRPHVDGWLGAIFNFLRGFDRPLNQFPSLHIALRTILADLYARHTRGPLHWALAAWFSLIGFSTLLTWQHHVIDLIGGFALAGICIYLFRDQPLRLPVTINPRVGGFYAIGALLLMILAISARPWSLLLLWPAISLTIAASAYFGAGPGIFRKTSGRLPWSTWLFLWPLLLGQRLSLSHYARQARPWDALTPTLWIGRKLNDRDAAEAIAQGVTAVLDLAGEFTEAAPFRAIHYRQLPIMDLTAPTPAQLEEAVTFIQQNSINGIVYVHCKAGYSRTGAVAGAYLLASGAADTVEAVAAQLRAARPAIILRPEILKCLHAYQQRHELV